jgi:hypothetical protein
MRIKPSTSFPYPVLSAETGDYAGADFQFAVEVSEVPEAGDVFLVGSLILEEESIARLVESGRAKSGLMVVCQETYLDQFFELPLGEFSVSLLGGQVRGEVFVRGVVISLENDLKLESSLISEEFPEGARVVQRGSIVALTREVRFEAGLEKLAPLESIFRLRRLDDLPDGSVEVDFESEAIDILASPSVYETLYNLRGMSARDLLLPALYLPVVISALDAMRSGNYGDRRWHSIVQARCHAEGIDVKAGDLMVSAQRLLGSPFLALKSVIEKVSL